MTSPLDYRAAGVDIEAADDAKSRIKALVESTFTSATRGAFGGFGGMVRLPEGMRAPLLVSSADGVGTKIKLAIDANVHDTIGHDLVNHCVNDILVQGATPLFFLDYVAFGALVPSVVESIVRGVAAGCRENGCALVGGETAEMPGVYTPPDYDLAGFIVGTVEESAVLGPSRVRTGDVLTATVLADAFCHHLVRSLVGCLLATGEARRPSSWPFDVLRAGRRDPGVTVVPARGLTLEEVGYPPDAELASRAQVARAVRTRA